MPGATSASAPLSVFPCSLAAACDRVADPRRVGRVTYALSALLTLAVAAILSNHLSVLAIAEWGARQLADLLGILGFPDGRTPCQSTLQRLFSKLEARRSRRPWAHFAPAVIPVPHPRAEGDGIAQRAIRQ